MSVVAGKRGTGDLTVITKANALVDYTLQICTNEKNFPKRYRWCLTNRIIDITYEICDLIIHANAVYVRPEDDSLTRRISYQTRALELTEVLLNQIDRAYRRFSLETRRVEHWTSLIEEIQRLLRGWRKADKERYKSIYG